MRSLLTRISRRAARGRQSIPGRAARGRQSPAPPRRERDPWLSELISAARADPAFEHIKKRVEEVRVESWLGEDERALLFALGAAAPGEGRIVEIGSWHGSSACYLAGGIARRGQGRLSCIDPHLAGPPWLGLSPQRGTLSRFRQVVEAVGVAEVIDARVGESSSVAAVWPAEPLDAVFIDGDHSFAGALKDFESWAPKLRPGGLVLVDDADDPALPDLLELIELLKEIDGVHWLDTVEGFAVFRRQALPAWTMLERLGAKLAPRGVHRAWNMSALHRIPLPGNYGRSRSWQDGGLDTAYELCFLAVCGPGPYAYTPASDESDRAMLRALSADRHDGEVLAAGPQATACRALLCRPEEAARFASLLQTGGVLIARDSGQGDPARELAVHHMLIDAGLDGCGWFEGTHWGVRSPQRLSADGVLELAIAARSESSARAASVSP